VSGGHGHPLSFHMSTAWCMWKKVLICWVISPALSPVLSGWHSVCLWGNNLVLQAAKSILFSPAHAELENYMLCQSQSAGQVIK